MKITVLGCWAPYPRAGGACSGYLLEGGGRYIMLEAGSGTLSRLMELMDFRQLDAVIVTHFHHDHYLDLFQLRHAIEGARRDGSLDNPVALYIPEEPAGEYNLLDKYCEAFQITKIESLEKETSAGSTFRRLELDGLTISFAPTKHLIPGYAVSFQEHNSAAGKIVFSGDSAPNEDLVALAEGADLFLCEASGLNKDAAYLANAHCTAGQAGELARAAGVSRLLLTHFWPEYDVEQLCAEAAAGFESPQTQPKAKNTSGARKLTQPEAKKTSPVPGEGFFDFSKAATSDAKGAYSSTQLSCARKLTQLKAKKTSPVEEMVTYDV